MPTTYAIPDGRTVMAATTYTGTGASLAINNAVNGVSFQPDWVWAKSRSYADNNVLDDSVRGVQTTLISNSTAAEYSDTTGLTSFNSNGFTINSASRWNSSAATYVAWQWKAGGTAVSNTFGSITSQVSANTTAGFSIVTYTGTGSTATVGHGLTVAPQMIIVKRRNASGDDWPVYHVGLTSAAYRIYLDTTGAQVNDPTGFMNSTAPTSSVFTVGSNGSINGSGGTYVAYCFAPVAGYSAFGSYTGNGSSDGTFVYTGFRPKCLLFKQSSAAGEYWHLMDTTRSPYNGVDLDLYPNLSQAEGTYSPPALDLLSNGFKFRTSNSAWNGSGATYIYACWAENPFKYANAR